MAPTPGGGGYWLVASDGGIFSFGDAQFYGSTGAIRLNQPIVGMATTPSGHGYWLVASDGGIFTFGDAQFYGQHREPAPQQARRGHGGHADGHGYWLVASDGGIFSFGDAALLREHRQPRLNKPVIGMIAGPNGAGYFLVASDGGIFAFGWRPSTAPWVARSSSTPSWAPRPSATAAATGSPTAPGGVELRGGPLLRLRAAQSLPPDRRHGRCPGQRLLLRGALPVRRLRLRHQQVPVLQHASPTPPDRHRAGRRGVIFVHQPVPRPRGRLGRSRPQPVHLLDLHDICRTPAGLPGLRRVRPGLQCRLPGRSQCVQRRPEPRARTPR